MLYEGMHRIVARDMLRNFTIADYPYIQQRRDKRKIHKNVYKVAYPENFKQKVLKTTDLELF
jgi:hypothetical protein